MAKISARGAKKVAEVKMRVDLPGGTTSTTHKALCSDGRILRRIAWKYGDGRPNYSTGYQRIGTLKGTRDLWVAYHIGNGWTLVK